MKIGMYYTDILILLADLTLISTYDNLSYNKLATQSLTYPGPSLGASNAVDGNTATCSRQFAIGLNAPYKTLWWKIDLGDVYNIHSITILFKTYDGYEDRQRGRFAGFSLNVSNTGDIKDSTLCYKDGPQLPPLEFTTTCVQYGRYVIFYNERKDGITYPMDYQTIVVNELCEVVVLGCNRTGVYGMNCNKLCPINCQNNLCNIENGSCFGCKPGWRDTLCDKECIEGMYGSKCLQQCLGHCRDNVTCNHVTGHCDGGCDKGWTGALCDKDCDDGTYGYNCTNNCSGHCLNNTPCNKQNGHCERGCKSGYTNTDCNKECPSQHYGMNCTGRCSGHCINNEPCDHISGVCPSGCQDGYTGILCTDACAEGYFGANCSRKCSPHCKPDTCRHADGSCTCTAGWMGNNCTTGCDDRTYGYDCTNNCSGHCLNDSPCNKQTGHCDRGCDPGYTNKDCNERCPSYYFGLDCRERCNGNCISDEPCDHVSGACTNGCKDGYFGTLCANVCSKGYFGKNCLRECSPYCKPDTCQHTDGWCICNSGWTGDNCTKSCVQSYGEDCQYPCSLQCYNNTCDRLNGRCLLGCINRFYGERCERENMLTIQNVSSFIMMSIGLSVSLLINLIFIVRAILLCRKNNSSMIDVAGNLLSCCKRSIYQDIVFKAEESSTYQELNLAGIASQNTATR